jgi:hypothetical protein
VSGGSNTCRGLRRRLPSSGAASPAFSSAGSGELLAAAAAAACSAGGSPAGSGELLAAAAAAACSAGGSPEDGEGAAAGPGGTTKKGDTASAGAALDPTSPVAVSCEGLADAANTGCGAVCRPRAARAACLVHDNNHSSLVVSKSSVWRSKVSLSLSKEAMALV